jgi:hypothetical protein
VLINFNLWFTKFNHMKKSLIRSLFALAILASMSSCATVFGGRVTEYQRTKPAAGQPAREIRAGALIADVLLFWPGAVVDFITGAIYRPQ